MCPSSNINEVMNVSSVYGCQFNLEHELFKFLISRYVNLKIVWMFAKLELSIKLTELELYFYYIRKPMTISRALTKPEFVWIFCLNLIFSVWVCPGE